MASGHPGEVCVITKSLNEISEDFSEGGGKAEPMTFLGLSSFHKNTATPPPHPQASPHRGPATGQTEI